MDVTMEQADTMKHRWGTYSCSCYYSCSCFCSCSCPLPLGARKEVRTAKLTSSED